MIHHIGVVGFVAIVTAGWLLGIVYGIQTIVRNAKQTFSPGYGWSHDWSGATFALFLLLCWLGVGFLVMAQIKT